MKNKIVLSVFGTRPEAIKMCPLVKELEQREKLKSLVCVTGQHRQMLDQVLEIFQLKPDYDLDIMRSGQNLNGITTRILMGIEEVLVKLQPDLVLVHGDTTTSFSCALAAFYAHVPVGHVEAGLRTFDRHSPFPEEVNRKLIATLADLHFCPTQNNKQNLLRENISENIYITGNTVIDAFRYTIRENYRFHDPVLQARDFSKGRTILITAHRRENLGESLENICLAVRDLVNRFEDLHVIYPVHLNPTVRQTVFSILGDVNRVSLIDPVDVTDMHNLMSRCYLVLTDSGGLQEEAPSLGIPVLVLRTETERPEAIQAGTVCLAGVKRDEIVRLATELLEDSNKYHKMAHAVNPYGNGHASEEIVEAIVRYLCV